MGLVAEYEISFKHLPLVEVAAAVSEATLTVDVGQPNQGGPPPFIVRVTGGTIQAVERAFQRTAFVGSIRSSDVTRRRLDIGSRRPRARRNNSGVTSTTPTNSGRSPGTIPSSRTSK